MFGLWPRELKGIFLETEGNRSSVKYQKFLRPALKTQACSSSFSHMRSTDCHCFLYLIFQSVFLYCPNHWSSLLLFYKYEFESSSGSCWLCGWPGVEFRQAPLWVGLYAGSCPALSLDRLLPVGPVAANKAGAGWYLSLSLRYVLPAGLSDNHGSSAIS